MNVWSLLKRAVTHKENNTMMTASEIMHKLTDLNEQIAAQQTLVNDLEDRTRTALADAMLDGGNADAVDTLRRQLRDAKDKLAELESVVPILCDRLQDARQAKRAAKIEEYSTQITERGTQQEALRREIARLDRERRELLQKLDAADNQVVAHVGERSRLTQRTDGWTGTLTDLEALARDPDAGPRPDECWRIVNDLREQEQVEGCKIGGVEIAFETATGKIIEARPFNIQSARELKDLEIIRREREQQAKLKAAA